METSLSEVISYSQMKDEKATTCLDNQDVHIIVAMEEEQLSSTTSINSESEMVVDSCDCVAAIPVVLNSESNITEMENTNRSQNETLNDCPEFSDINSSQSSISLPSTPNTYDKKLGTRASDSPSTQSAKQAKTLPRSTRSSQNPDFAAKHRKFLNSVHDPIRRDLSDSDNSQSSLTPTLPKVSKEKSDSKPMERKTNADLKRKSSSNIKEYITTHKQSDTDDEAPSKRKRTSSSKEPTKVVGGIDSYCWRCHKDGTVFPCGVANCKRVYHIKCVQLSESPPPGWMCPECSTIMHAENADTRSRAMSEIKIDKLCYLLKFALNRMKAHEGAEDFAEDVDPKSFPNYRDYIVNPMSLRKLEQNIAARMYGSTEAFTADCKWLIHNCIIFNSMHSKFTTTARALGKICKQEMSEIENCVNCYDNAHTRSNDTWFVEACVRRPHVLIWAKLKGYPFWPAKAMGMNGEFVDARFFGAHDKSNVPLNMCFLLSKNPPVPQAGGKNRRVLEKCIAELELHIKKLRDKFGVFEYAPFKMPYDPQNEDMQIVMMLPRYDPKKSGNRKSRMTLHNEGARKMICQSKGSPSPLETSPARKTSVASSPSSSQTEKKEEDNAKNLKTGTTKSKSTPQENKTQESKPRLSVGVSKLKRTPLTAAAKKCFALEERICIKCDSKVSVNWSIDKQGKSLCHSCTLASSETSPSIDSPQKKTCSKCLTQITGSWHRAFNGDLFCDKCKPDMPKPEDKTNSQGKCCAYCRTTITMSWLRNPAGLALCSSCGTAEGLLHNSQSKTISSLVESVLEDTRKEGTENVTIDQGAGGDTLGKEGVDVGVPQQRSLSDGAGDQLIESPNKVSIVDRLKEKLCFVVEEAIKDQLLNDQPCSVEVSETADEIEHTREVVPEIETGDVQETTDNHKSTENMNQCDRKIVQVMLHDLKNDKNMMDKIKESELKKSNRHTTNGMEIDGNSESDTDGSGMGSDVTDEESNKKKKQNNINKVVKTLQERKISIDEVGESNTNSLEKESSASLEKESSAIMLDDSNDESSHILIIDEGEYHSACDSKKSSGKSDKNKRKSGKPAKVCSRTSSSNDSLDHLSPLNRKDDPVLDEVSGQFVNRKRNVTINLGSDESPKKKDKKEIRSVNLSKSLSLSVVKDSMASDLSDLVEIDDDELSVVGVPKPTARKSFSNSVGQKSLQPLQKKLVLPSDVRVKLAQTMIEPSPPPLISVRQPTKTFGQSRPPGVTSPRPPALTSMRADAPRPTPPPSPASHPSARGAPGVHSAQIDRAVQKLSSNLRTVVEEILRDMSEMGHTEATIKAMQVEMERLQFRHRAEMAELKHNTDLVIKEMRAALEADKQRSLLDARHKYEIEKENAVSETKKKQWCSFCFKEAALYCCWNTAYCSYQCQQSHWLMHMNTCMNKQPNGGNEGSSEETASLAVMAKSPPQSMPPPHPPQPVQRPVPPFSLQPGQMFQRRRKQSNALPPPALPPPMPSQLLPPQYQAFQPNQLFHAVTQSMQYNTMVGNMYPVDPRFHRGVK